MELKGDKRTKFCQSHLFIGKFVVYIAHVNQALMTGTTPAAVAGEVQRLYQTMFPEAGSYFVPQVFGWAIDCFTGYFEDYQPGGHSTTMTLSTRSRGRCAWPGFCMDAIVPRQNQR